MPLSLSLDIQQGLSFTAGSQRPVGHLLTASFFGTPLTADLTVTDPETSSSTPAAGVLSDVQWDETVGGPISMTAWISAHNDTVVQQLLHGSPANTAVVIDFRAHDYDHQMRRYYAAFAPTQPPLSAIIGKSGPSLELNLASIPMTVGSTQLYAMHFTIVPPPHSQTLRIETGVANSVVNPWGLALH